MVMAMYLHDGTKPTCVWRAPYTLARYLHWREQHPDAIIIIRTAEARA